MFDALVNLVNITDVPRVLNKSRSEVRPMCQLEAYVFVALHCEIAFEDGAFSSHFFHPSPTSAVWPRHVTITFDFG